jgi:phytoene synthase
MDAIVSENGCGKNPERALAIGYARASDRAALAALFGLDDALAAVLRTTREPIVGQMRLTWWHDALTRLDGAEPPAEPTLRALAAHVVPRAIRGDQLAGIAEGWEELLDVERLESAAILRFSAMRGERLFVLAGQLLGAGPEDPVVAAGAGWALADLARHLADPAAAQAAAALARTPISIATAARWSRAGRPLGALAHLARMDLDVPVDRPIPTGSPARVARLLRHRLTGR